MTGSFDFVIGKLDQLLQDVLGIATTLPEWAGGLDMLASFKKFFDMFKDEDVKQRVADVLLERQGAAAESELHRLLVNFVNAQGGRSLSSIAHVNALLDANPSPNPDVVE